MIELMIVDDHPMVREGLEAMLMSEEGFDVVALAPNGEAALAKAQEVRPDVVLSDIRMPKMDGFTMLGRWKDVPFLRKAYLILMLTDENYALEATCPEADEAKNLYYCTCLSVFNHSYWIVGLTVGAVVVCLLGHVVDPEIIRRHTNGMEFSMAALFLVIFTDQMRAMKK